MSNIAMFKLDQQYKDSYLLEELPVSSLSRKGGGSKPRVKKQRQHTTQPFQYSKLANGQGLKCKTDKLLANESPSVQGSVDKQLSPTNGANSRPKEGNLQYSLLCGNISKLIVQSIKKHSIHSFHVFKHNSEPEQVRTSQDCTLGSAGSQEDAAAKHQPCESIPARGLRDLNLLFGQQGRASCRKNNCAASLESLSQTKNRYLTQIQGNRGYLEREGRSKLSLNLDPVQPASRNVLSPCQLDYSARVKMPPLNSYRQRKSYIYQPYRLPSIQSSAILPLKQGKEYQLFYSPRNGSNSRSPVVYVDKTPQSRRQRFRKSSDFFVLQGKVLRLLQQSIEKDAETRNQIRFLFDGKFQIFYFFLEQLFSAVDQDQMSALAQKSQIKINSRLQAKILQHLQRVADTVEPSEAEVIAKFITKFQKNSPFFQTASIPEEIGGVSNILMLTKKFLEQIKLISDLEQRVISIDPQELAAIVSKAFTFLLNDNLTELKPIISQWRKADCFPVEPRQLCFIKCSVMEVVFSEKGLDLSTAYEILQKLEKLRHLFAKTRLWESKDAQLRAYNQIQISLKSQLPEISPAESGELIYQIFRHVQGKNITAHQISQTISRIQTAQFTASSLAWLQKELTTVLQKSKFYTDSLGKRMEYLFFKIRTYFRLDSLNLSLYGNIFQFANALQVRIANRIKSRPIPMGIKTIDLLNISALRYFFYLYLNEFDIYCVDDLRHIIKQYSSSQYVIYKLWFNEAKHQLMEMN